MTKKYTCYKCGYTGNNIHEFAPPGNPSYCRPCWYGGQPMTGQPPAEQPERERILCEALGRVLMADGVLNGVPATPPVLLVAADDYCNSKEKHPTPALECEHETCPACGGSGAMWDDGTVSCTPCGGRGYQRKDKQPAPALEVSGVLHDFRSPSIWPEWEIDGENLAVMLKQFNGQRVKLIIERGSEDAES